MVAAAVEQVLENLLGLGRGGQLVYPVHPHPALAQPFQGAGQIAVDAVGAELGGM